MKKYNFKKLSINLFEPIDSASIVFLRIVFGLCMIYQIFGGIYHNAAYYAYIVPKFNLHYFAFQFLEPLSETWMKAIFYIMFFSAIFITIGFKYRIATITFFISYSYIFFLEPGYYVNHTYLICLITFLLIFIPANRNFSIDALINKKITIKPLLKWHLQILRFQFAIVYFFGGIMKIDQDWLSGFVFSQIITYETESFFIRWIADNIFSVQSIAISSMIFDLLIVPFLIWKKTRIYAFIISVFFNLMNMQMFGLDVFPYLMIAGTLLFFEPSWLRYIFYKAGFVKEKFIIFKNNNKFINKKRKVIIIFLFIYISFQILFPIRHLVYPGEVRWTEEGYMFSWNMFARIKELSEIPLFIAYNKETKSIINIDLEDYVKYNPKKFSRMIHNPAYIHEFAWILAEDLSETNRFDIKNLEIYAKIIISFNGSTPQNIIDPNFNLLSEKPFTLKHRKWINKLIRDKDQNKSNFYQNNYINPNRRERLLPTCQ